MRVIYDLFPAYVSVAPASLPLAVEDLTSAPPSPGARQVATCRVIVTLDPARIIIATDSSSGPLVVFNAAYDPDPAVAAFHKSPARRDDSYLTTLKGDKLAFKKDEDCGCGSRLRSWNPYNTVGSTKDPTS